MQHNTIPHVRAALQRTTALAALVALSGPALATEGGGSIYPHGAENFMGGAMPPPGLYGFVYGQAYKADRLKDDAGNTVPVPGGFKIRAQAVAPRLVWVTGETLLSGNLAMHLTVPLVNMEVNAGGVKQQRSGVGDVTLGAAAGFHHNPGLHSVAALDLHLPTGRYDRGNLANIGRNYSAIEPMYLVSLVNPGGLNIDAKFGYIINRRNKDTDYRSGHEFHFDYAVGWGLGNGWVAGLGGYFYRQLTDDDVGGVDVPGNRGRTLAIGPALKYDSGKGWFVTAKWERETAVRNRPQGDSLWIKAVFPL
jgi:hypothetical protein